MKQSDMYSVDAGKLARTRKSCPRCGEGTFLAQHPGRLYCGKCHYTEFEKGFVQEKTQNKPKKENKPKGAAPKGAAPAKAAEPAPKKKK